MGRLEEEGRRGRGGEKEEEGMKEGGRKEGGAPGREERLRPHLSLQVCRQPHLRCAQLQGLCWTGRTEPHLGRVVPCSSVCLAKEL